MTWLSVHGKNFLRHSRMPLLRINGTEIGATPFPVRGRRLYVDSAYGAAGGAGESIYSPLSTLQAAIDRLDSLGSQEDNTGATIVVMPNHAETVTGASGLTFDVPGLSVIGLGNYNQRPRFLMDGGTTVTGVISAADVTLSNLEFASGHSNVATCLGVTGVGARLDRLKFGNNTTNEDFLVCITATGADNTADGLEVTDCEWNTVDTDDDQMISFIGSAKDVRIMRNRMMSLSTATAQLIISATGKILTNAEIGWNIHQNRMTQDELFISNDGTTNTGFVHNNYCGHADVTGAHDPGWTTGGWRLFNNLSVSVDTLQGVVVPAADVDL